MKILVTGAGGFVGRYLLRLLQSHGHALCSLGIGGSYEMDIPVHEVDILDCDAVQEVMQQEQPDAVIHLAAMANVGASWDKPALTLDVNVRGTVNVLQSLHEACPAARFLNIGSSDEYGLAAKFGQPLTEDMPCLPQNPYSVSKLCAEQTVLLLGRKYGMRVVSTRSFNHFGAGQARGFAVSDFAAQIAAMEKGMQDAVLRVGDLSAARDFTAVEDVVAAYAALVEEDVPSGVYNVCSGNARKISDMLEELVQLSNLKIEVQVDPAKLRPVDVPCFVGCADKLREATGWKPVVPHKLGLQRALDDWRSRQ